MKNKLGHYTENDLEMMLLSPETFSDGEKKTVMLHLDQCLLCKESYEQMQRYHETLDESLKTPPTERDAAFTRGLVGRTRLSLQGRRAQLSGKSESLVETFAEVIDPYRRSFVERAIRYLQIHPVRSAGAVSFAAVAMAAAFLAIRPTLDKNPAYAQGKDGFLVVNNNHGEELWQKRIGTGFITDGADFDNNRVRVFSMQDLDGDGTNEVLSTFGWTSMPFPTANAAICYNSDGMERWRYEIHRTMKLGGTSYSDDYRFYHLEAGKFTKSGFIDVIVAARHETWSPNVIVRLEGLTGKFLSEFWHPGELRKFDHKDLDHDGVEELLYGGQNNRLQHASLVIFDPRTIQGSAPAPENYYPEGIPPGTEKYYLIFPSSDMKRVAQDITNQVDGLHVTSDGMIEVIVNERGPTAGTLYYYFDSTLTCRSIRPSDSFTSAHEQLILEGKLSTQLTDEYFDALCKGILYWDGEKFVDKPTINRHYVEAMRAAQSP